MVISGIAPLKCRDEFGPELVCCYVNAGDTLYIRLHLLHLVLPNVTPLGLAGQPSCIKVPLTALICLLLRLQKRVSNRRYDNQNRVQFIQPVEFTDSQHEWGSNQPHLAWKVCRQKWQVKPEWLLMWREAWFLSNPKDCTGISYSLFLLYVSCFRSNFTPFQKKKTTPKPKQKQTKKQKPKTQILHLWGFKEPLSVHNYAQRKYKNSLTIWESCSSKGTDFCMRKGTWDQLLQINRGCKERRSEAEA